MSQLTTTCIVALLFASLTVPLSGQAPSLNVEKVVKDVAAKCQAAKEYAFEGELLLAGQRGSEPGKVLSKASVRLAVARPGKYLLRLAPEDKDEYLLVSNGQKSWAYVPKLKQYTEEESGARDEQESNEESGAGASDQERDLAETFARLVVPILTDLYKTAQNADGGGYGEVKYENKKQRWPVVRVMSRPDQRQGQSLTELTLDPETLRIGRLVWANLTREKGEKTVISLTVDFSSFRLGESPPDSSFTFEPPKKARLVDAVPIPGQTGSFLLNRPAPDFELKTLEGERIRLAELRGRPVLLSFWASWCAPCRRELPALAKLQEEFKSQGLVVLGVNDEGKGPARQFAKEAGLTFPTLDDSGLKAHRLYRVRSIPTTFLIDAEGKVVRFLSGARDHAALRGALKGAGL